MTKENKISMDSTTCVIPTEKRTVDHGTSQYTYWLVITIGAVVLLLMALGTVIAVIDPYFHYHAPKDGWYYLLYDERYINDGIVRHFDYDTIITGTSMTQNFKTSECDAIFDCESVKVPFSGGGFKEINENLKRAFAAKDDIRYVIRGLDTGGLSQDKDWARYGEYPTYLTNNNPFDDVYYLLNKEVLFGDALQMAIETAYGTRPTTFDAYNNWMAGRTFGKEAVLATYGVNEPPAEEVVLTEAEELCTRENIRQNVTELTQQEPNTIFYYFLTPYSICWWDQLYMAGTIRWNIEAQRIAIEEILQCPNIKLYSFFTNYEMICDLNNYKDTIHYGEWINSQMLQWMKDDEYLLTVDNYEAYLADMEAFYTTYDYAALHEV